MNMKSIFVLAGFLGLAAVPAGLEAKTVYVVGGPELVSRQTPSKDPAEACLGSWGDILAQVVHKKHALVLEADAAGASSAPSGRWSNLVARVQTGDVVVWTQGAVPRDISRALADKGCETVDFDMRACARRLAAQAGEEEARTWYRAVYDGKDYSHTTRRGAAVLARAFRLHIERRHPALASLFRPLLRACDSWRGALPAGGETVSVPPFTEVSSAHMDVRVPTFLATVSLVPEAGASWTDARRFFLSILPCETLSNRVETGTLRIDFKGLPEGRLCIRPLGETPRAPLALKQNRQMSVDTARLPHGPACVFELTVTPWRAPRVVDVTGETLAAALADVARARAAGDDLTPYTLRLAPGDYVLADGLKLTAAHARANWAPLKLVSADPARRARLLGSTPIKGWTRTSFNGRTDVWMARAEAFGAPALGKLFFYNGRKMEPARWPNLDPDRPYTSGFAFADGKAIGKSIYTQKPVGMFTDEIPLRASDRRPWANPSEGWVIVFPRHNWWNRVFPITSVTTNGVIKLKNAHTPVEQGLFIWDRWCIMGVGEELDAPGEWYFDVAGKKLYFLPPEGEDPNRGLCSLSHAPYILNMVRTANVVLENLTFTAGGGGISLDQCDDIALGGLSIHDVGFHGGSGISMSGHRIRVFDCDIWHVGGHGICVHDNGKERAYTDRHGHVIENNYIHHVGQVNSHGIGIQMSGQGIVLRHNYIHDTPRCGIFGYGRFCDIAYNRVRHTNTINDDTGAIYGGGWVSGQGSRVRYNWFSQSIGFQRQPNGGYRLFKGACGIYPDEGCGGLEVYGNHVEHCHHAAMHLHNGRWITISNNVFVSNGALPIGAKTTQLSLQTWNNATNGYFVRVRRADIARDYHRLVAHDARWLRFPCLAQAPDRDDVCFNTNGTTMMGVKVSHNIFYYPDQGTGMVLRAWNVQADRNPFDCNLYWPGAGSAVRFGVSGMAGDWAAWQAAGQDVHSRIADPLFENPGAGDYRLKPHSPAYACGFADLPYDKMGLRITPLRPALPDEAPGLREHPEWLSCE